MDIEEMPCLENDPHLMRHRPRSLRQLSLSSGFSSRQIQFLYRNFKQECPNGLMTQSAFKNVFVQIFPFGDCTVYSKLLWKMLSRDSSKDSQTSSTLISFEDFLRCLSELLNGNEEEKLTWIFDFYDTDSDGFISAEDMSQTVRSIYALMGSSGQPEVNSDTLHEVCRQLFVKMDVSRQGRINKYDFIQGLRQGGFDLAYLWETDKSIIMMQ